MAFEAHFAGMGEDGRAVALHVLIEPDAAAPKPTLRVYEYTLGTFISKAPEARRVSNWMASFPPI